MIALTDPDPRFRSRVTRTLGDAWTCLEVAGAAELEAVLSEHAGQVDVVLLGPSLGTTPALRTAERVREIDPAVSSILISPKLGAQVLRAAVRSGIRDVVTMPCGPEQLRAAVTRARALSGSLRDREPPRATSTSRVTTVFSLKGGSGKSVVASNLAVHLAAAGNAGAALLDLDLQSGDLAVMFQLRPEWTIRDAAERGADLDDDALLALLCRHGSGVRLLAAPVDPAQADDVPPEAVARILTILRTVFPHVVVDCPPAFTEHVLTALDASDECVLVCSLDVPSVKNASLAMRTLGELGFSRDRIRIVLNRADEDVALTVHHVEKALGTSVDTTIPSTREITLSVNRGIPIALDRDDHPLAQALARIGGGTHRSPSPRGLVAQLRRSRR